MRMPFGRHKGEDLDDVPADYLRWVLRNCRNLTPWLQRAIHARLADEGDEDPVAARLRAIVCRHERELHDLRRQLHQAEAGRRVWRSCFRQLALLAHPDRGGSTELMTLLVQVNDAMKEDPHHA